MYQKIFFMCAVICIGSLTAPLCAAAREEMHRDDAGSGDGWRAALLKNPDSSSSGGWCSEKSGGFLQDYEAREAAAMQRNSQASPIPADLACFNTAGLNREDTTHVFQHQFRVGPGGKRGFTPTGGFGRGEGSAQKRLGNLEKGFPKREKQRKQRRRRRLGEISRGVVPSDQRRSATFPELPSGALEQRGFTQTRIYGKGDDSSSSEKGAIHGAQERLGQLDNKLAKRRPKRLPRISKAVTAADERRGSTFPLTHQGERKRKEQKKRQKRIDRQRNLTKRLHKHLWLSSTNYSEADLLDEVDGYNAVERMLKSASTQVINKTLAYQQVQDIFEVGFTGDNHLIPPQRVNMPFEKNRVQTTYLHCAVKVGHVALVHFLLEQGADFLARDGNEKLPYEVSLYTYLSSLLSDCDALKREAHVHVIRMLYEKCDAVGEEFDFTLLDDNTLGQLLHDSIKLGYLDLVRDVLRRNPTLISFNAGSEEQSCFPLDTAIKAYASNQSELHAKIMYFLLNPVSVRDVGIQCTLEEEIRSEEEEMRAIALVQATVDELNYGDASEVED